MNTTYIPSENFLAWLQKKKPRAAQYLSEKKAYPMYACPHSGRHRINVPGTHADIDGAIEFDRQAGTAELCLVLDCHPDLKQA